MCFIPQKFFRGFYVWDYRGSNHQKTPYMEGIRRGEGVLYPHYPRIETPSNVGGDILIY